MALAASLIPGFKYRITRGLFAEEVVTIVSNIPFPDGDPDGRQRKITVLGPDGEQMYILPRLLDERPVGVEGEQKFTPVIVQSAPVASAPVSTDAPVGNLNSEQIARRLVANPITDPMDPRLDHLRPSRAKVKRYLNRVMSNGMSDVDFLLMFTSDAYRAHNEGRPANIMLKGDTQSGKTFLVEVLAVKWADAMGLDKPMPIFTLSGSSGITDYDLFGQTTSYTDPETGLEALVWLPGLVDLAAQVGGILYLDEINAFSERVTSSLHPLCDHRHHFINRNKPVFKNGQFMPDAVTASMDLWVIGTYNEGYRGMGDMNEAFINRFRHIQWGYDKDIEAKLIASPAIRLLGDALRTARTANQVRTPVGTAALQRVEEDVAAFGIALGMEVLIGMFKSNERAVVESIIEDRSIYVMLQEEQRQSRLTP
jgi:MoxR-like ATPase